MRVVLQSDQRYSVERAQRLVAAGYQAAPLERARSACCTGAESLIEAAHRLQPRLVDAQREPYEGAFLHSFDARCLSRGSTVVHALRCVTIRRRLSL